MTTTTRPTCPGTTTSDLPVTTSLARNLAAPLSLAAIGAGATVVTFLFAPKGQLFFPRCPFHAVTGLWCPGCGATRALHDLTHGNILGALHQNVFFVLLVPVAIYSWVWWVQSRLGHDRLRRPQLGARASWGVLVVLLAFGIARNIDVAPLTWLAPTNS